MTDVSGTAGAIELSAGTREWILAFADDEHIIGARHTAWIGLGPFLEEDLAFCSIAQDELGHAIALYELLGVDLDRFALMRDPGEYRSAWLCELPCEQWNEALIRHWLYDEAEALRWASLSHSTLEPLRFLAARAQREEAFHIEHAAMFLSRLARGDDQGRARVNEALASILPAAVGLWDAVEGEATALAEGITSASSAELGAQWRSVIESKLSEWGFVWDWPEAVPAQQHRTARSEHFAALQLDLQEVISVDVDAVW